MKLRKILFEAGQRIATALDQEQVAQIVLETVLKLISSVEVVVFYYQLDIGERLQATAITGAGDAINAAGLLDETLVAEALQYKQTIYLPNWSKNSDQPRKSLIIEPLVLVDISLGALGVISFQPAAFDDDHRQALTMLVNQASIALQNARLYAEARRIDELKALYETGKAINQSLDLQETLTTTMTISRSLTGASVSNIYLYVPDNGGYRIDSVVTLSGTSPLADIDRHRSSDIAWEVVKNNHPILTHESEIDGASQASAQTIQTWLAVPITTGDTPMAVLTLGSESANTFIADDLRLMQIIASQAAAAIDNARLHEEVQQRLQQTEALSAISQSISTTLDLRRVLELVVQSAVKTIQVASHSLLYLLDQSTKQPRLEAKASLQEWSLPSNLEAVREKTIQQVIQQQATIRVLWQSEEQTAWSLLIAPLKTNEAIIGAISVESPHQNAFSFSDETLLNTFASHASIAIQNANMFRELSAAYLDLSRKQEEILHSHRTLQALFDSITDGLYMVDRDLKIIAINQAEAMRLGTTPDALVGHACDDSLWEEAAEDLIKIVQNTIESGEEKNWGSQTDTGNRGHFTDYDVRTYPIFETPANVSQVIILAQDVSEKRRLQASLFRSANMAAVGQLASSIAHQINNPLTIIIANAQIMEMETLTDSPDYPIIAHIVEAGTQIRQIVQNLLDFSTQDSYAWFETDIQETIEDALSLVAHSLRKSNIEVIKQIENLPTVVSSASHLKLLWMNLLLNARDAIFERVSAISPKQKEEPGIIKICVSKINEEYVQIQIVDNGVGIPHQYRDHLFHPFFTTKTINKNLGLGLYTCRAIVEAHQGQIEIDNPETNSGTTVTVTLPIQILV
ncbi:MAG: GAF domain-containing protein [Anaerolineae bacterium]|nr:GAF domain-containing protein [Anaerolineae bacterium]MCB0222452.1 GAF domain-containing protein [Anaerolineae bacterium]